MLTKRYSKSRLLLYFGLPLVVQSLVPLSVNAADLSSLNIPLLTSPTPSPLESLPSLYGWDDAYSCIAIQYYLNWLLANPPTPEESQAGYTRLLQQFLDDATRCENALLHH